jgi:hypothetical protein
LALVIGALAWTWTAGAAALKAAGEKNAAIATYAVGISALNGQMQISQVAKDAKIRQLGATIDDQRDQIADLRAHQGHTIEVAEAAVDQAADLEAVYRAGAPIVEAVHVDALGSWYALLGMRVDLVTRTVTDLRDQARIDGGKIAELGLSNLKIAKERDELRALNDGDLVTIRDQDALIAQQRGTIAAQAGDIQGAAELAARAALQISLARAFAWIFLATTVGEGIFIAGSAVGWW